MNNILMRKIRLGVHSNCLNSIFLNGMLYYFFFNHVFQIMCIVNHHSYRNFMNEGNFSLFNQSRVGAHTQRRTLLTTGKILCTRLPSVVLYASVKQTSTGEDAASCQDGEGDKHRVTHQLR